MIARSRGSLTVLPMPAHTLTHTALPTCVGMALRQLRLERTKLSQETLAHAAGIHRTYVGVLERGAGNPTITALERAARVLGVRVSEILRLAEHLGESAPGPEIGSVFTVGQPRNTAPVTGTDRT